LEIPRRSRVSKAKLLKERTKLKRYLQRGRNIQTRRHSEVGDGYFLEQHNIIIVVLSIIPHSLYCTTENSQCHI